MGKLKVFVSSTYYDLKHVRNNLKRFIEQFGFDPIMNEFGTITYDYTSPLDQSCYTEAKDSDIFILIIGGRYGSLISEQDMEFKVKYNEYLSITRKEYRTAFENNIPIYIFVDKNVYTEFHTYLNNKTNNNFKYAYVDDVKVFEFIAEAIGKFKNNIICTFERNDDIEQWLKEQWSGLFSKLLKQYQVKQNNDTMMNSISKMEMLTDQINKMITEVGKKVLNGNNEYNEILYEQNKKLMKFYAKDIVSNIKFQTESLFITQTEAAIIENILFKEFFDKNETEISIIDKHGNYTDVNILYHISTLVSTQLNEKVIIDGLDFNKTYRVYNEEVKPIITKFQEFKNDFRKYFLYYIEDSINPF